MNINYYKAQTYGLFFIFPIERDVIGKEDFWVRGAANLPVMWKLSAKLP